MTKYDKLVRDKIPEILDGKGISYEKRVATDVEYQAELVKKLKEEVEEFLEEKSAEELADVLEVIEALKALPDYSETDELKKKKYSERGGFRKKIICAGEK